MGAGRVFLLVVAALAGACGDDGGDGADAAPARCSPDAPFDVVMPVPALSSDLRDASVRLAPDLLTAYMTRREVSGTARDLWIARRARPDLPWGTIEPLDGYATAESEGHLSLTGDGLRAYMEIGPGPDKIHMVERASLADPLPPPAAEGTFETGSQPWVTADGSALYVAAPGVVATVSRIPLEGGLPVGPPEVVAALDSGIATYMPMVNSDETVLYVFREGAVWVTTRASPADGFGPPRLIDTLDAPDADDIATWISADGCTVYLSSDRGNQPGDLDVYVAVRSP